MKKRAKRPACKPVKAWAVVDCFHPNLMSGWTFDTYKTARSFLGDFSDDARIVRVEIREIRKARKGGGK